MLIIVTATAAILIYKINTGNYAGLALDGLFGFLNVGFTILCEKTSTRGRLSPLRLSWIAQASRVSVFLTSTSAFLYAGYFQIGFTLALVYVYLCPLWLYLIACNSMPPGWKKPVKAPARKLAIDHA